jgi:multiple sugar transport system ATP-binding protein
MNFISGELFSNGKLSFRSKLFEIELPDRIEKNLTGYQNRQVVMGVRPEHIYDVSLQQSKTLSQPQKIEVDVVEPIGNEIFVYFSDADQNYCMRMAPDKLHQTGEKIEIALDLNQVFFFDPESEERLT